MPDGDNLTFEDRSHGGWVRNRGDVAREYPDLFEDGDGS